MITAISSSATSLDDSAQLIVRDIAERDVIARHSWPFLGSLRSPI
jgi:hypothetical protein